MNLPDLGKLSEPRQEIELLDDEAKVLLESSRCQKCRHLSAFHTFEREITRPSLALKCRICKETCAIERH